MKLPNVQNAEIPDEKILKYLLDTENSGGKAEFFFRFGFTVASWQYLQHSIHHHAILHEVVKTNENLYGTKYIVEGELRSPDKRNPRIRTVWIIEKTKDRPRFVTAYPINEEI